MDLSKGPRISRAQFLRRYPAGQVCAGAGPTWLRPGHPPTQWSLTLDFDEVFRALVSFTSAQASQLWLSTELRAVLSDRLGPARGLADLWFTDRLVAHLESSYPDGLVELSVFYWDAGPSPCALEARSIVGASL